MPQESLARFQTLLRSLFQFDSAELDFGIYRVLNYKRAEIEGFITRRLPAILEKAFQQYSEAERTVARQEVAHLRQQLVTRLGPDAVDASGALREAFRATNLGAQYLSAFHKVESIQASEALQETIYNDLYVFFSRYYEDGDFVSKRRRGRQETYVVPYNGEEVLLHWANRDQHYVKTYDRLNAYRFQDGAVTVDFRVVAAASGTHPNERRYYVVPAADALCWDAEKRHLTIRFHHRPLNNAEAATYGKTETQRPQARLNEAAAKRILAQVPDATARLTLAGGSGSGDPLLLRHLQRFTRRSASDFFVHRSLGPFLRRELDFFLKNEALQLDDLLQGASVDLPAVLQRAVVLRAAAEPIIDLLAQVEDFQKHLFEKRKFVLRTEYCLTIDRVPPFLLPDVVQCRAQLDEWRSMYALDQLLTAAGLRDGEVTVEFLQGHPTLVVDTRHFDSDFKDRLLSAIEDLDHATDGLLIKSENSQALNLLAARYRGQAQLLYLDPPYNTGGDEFIYKDAYQHSSWLTMMADRLQAGRELLQDLGVALVSIDDHEVYRLRHLMNSVYGEANFIAELVWEKGRKNDAKLFSVGHEYMLAYARSLAALRERGVVWREPKPGAQEIWDEFCRLKGMHGEDYETIQAALREWYRRLPADHPSRALSRYKWVDQYGPWRDHDISWPSPGGPRYEVMHPVTRLPCIVPANGWRFSTPEAMQRQIDLGLVVFRDDHTQPPFRKSHLRPVTEEVADGDDASEGEPVDVGMQVMPSVIYKQSQVAVKYLRNLMGGDYFSNPKDHEMLARLIRYCTSALDGGWVVDYFGGSGATAHAVIDLIREEAGRKRRRYLMVEMGEHFWTVLLPRIKRAVYSKNWSDGLPTGGAGISHLLKYQVLEQYEDSLNNVRLRPEAGQQALELFGDEYLVRYMLGFEAAGSPSLLNLEALTAPFSYTMRVREGATEVERPIDLVETFHYLLGVKVRRYRTHRAQGRLYRATLGERDGERIAAVWRDCADLAESREALDRDRQVLQEVVLPSLLGAGVAADRIFVNGPCSWDRAESTEAEFQRLMFSEVA